MLKRIARFLKRPGPERSKLLKEKLEMLSALPFYFGKANLRRTFLTYHPDSYARFKSHSEFGVLFDSFKRHNRLNNSGDVTRLWSLILNIKQVLSEDVPGDFAELGVWRGNTASVLAHYAARENRKVYLFDTFEGFDSKDLSGIDHDKEIAFTDTSLTLVREVIGASSDVCRFVAGHFPSTITDEHRNNRYSVVSIDCDLYEPMKAGLNFFYPLMPQGGLLLIHDYSGLFWDGAKKAVDEFCTETGEHIILMPDKSGSAFIRKSK